MKILFIACYSPFINNSAAIRTLQYLNKLSNTEGMEVHLLTVDFPADSRYYDENLAKMIDDKVKVHLISGGAIFNKLMPRKQGLEKHKSFYGGKKFKYLQRIKKNFAIPDMYIGWARKAGKYAVQIMKKEKFDVIFSMHEPPSSHLCAYYVKKRFRDVKWITYWSDPWLKDSTRINSNLIKSHIEKKLESKVIRYADKFLFVTEPNRDDYINTYGLDKKLTYIVSRGFELEFYTGLEKEDVPTYIQKEKINIVYAGEIFTKLRDIRPFISAVKRLRSENIELYNRLNILFFGNIDNENIKEELEKIDRVRVEGRIPFNEAVKYMVNSEVLLLFGNKNSTQIPAKIYDYFGTKAKIFIIYGDNNDPIKKIVEENKKCICKNNDEHEILSVLKSITQDESDKLICDRVMKYEWNNVVADLVKIIREE